jgi:hypothetical protein
MKGISRGDAEDAEKGKAVEYCGAGRLEACITIMGNITVFASKFPSILRYALHATQLPIIL